MKIYTKKGDDGTTSLLVGKRISKNDPFVNACGDLDELNAFIGLARARMNVHDINENLIVIQNCLFEIGASIAAKEKNDANKYAKDILFLENTIDKMDGELQPLKNFILPGGSENTALAHVCRAVCRRVERSVVALGDEVDHHIISYLNRLSDYFFVLARYIALLNNEEPVVWNFKKQNPKEK